MKFHRDRGLRVERARDFFEKKRLYKGCPLGSLRAPVPTTNLFKP
jgi:hypothetical protein